VSIEPQPRRRFARNLRARRVEMGMSQESLGRMASLHPTEISRLERGVRDPRLATIVQVAQALDVTPAILLDGIE
jgi:transcriptional regulator with XRE-family HTH domain